MTAEEREKFRMWWLEESGLSRDELFELAGAFVRDESKVSLWPADLGTQADEHAIERVGPSSSSLCELLARSS